MIRFVGIFIFVAAMPCISSAATFTVSKNLSFGTLAPTAASGSVVLALNGSMNTNSSATIISSGTTYYPGTAVYTGSGLSSVANIVNMTFLSSSVTLSNGAGGTVTVNNFTITPNLQVSLLNPSATANVGATMNFTAASTPGNYTGSVQIQASSLLGGSATVTLPIILTLWRMLSVTQTVALNFGALEVTGGNSVVNISPQNGTRTVTSGQSGVNLIQSKPGAAGEFLITGNPNAPVTITLPSSATLAGPGMAMTVNNFTRFPSAENSTLNASGTMTLKVGASLNVNAAQAAGTYNGTYTVTVSY